MKDHDYDRAEEEDRQHFIQCHVCGKWIDCRDMDEVFAHQEKGHQAPGNIVRIELPTKPPG